MRLLEWLSTGPVSRGVRRVCSDDHLPDTSSTHVTDDSDIDESSRKKASPSMNVTPASASQPQVDPSLSPIPTRGTSTPRQQVS